MIDDRNAAADRLERELLAAHICADMLCGERLFWLREAFELRALRLALAVEAARFGFLS